MNVVSTTLQALPHVRMTSVAAEAQATESGADFEILLEIRGHPLRLLVHEKRYAYPRDIHALIRQLTFPCSRKSETPCLPMLVTPALPMSSREILREANIAYADSSGSLYLAFGESLFYVDRPVPHIPIRKIFNIYKGKTVQVLHVLLAMPERPWHIGELAAEAGVAPSLVHKVFQILEDQLWMERIGQGPKVVRLLRDPGALLNAWRAEHSLKQYDFLSYYGWAQTPHALRNALSSALEEMGSEYALTLSSGAEFVAPFVTGVEKLSLLVPNTVPIQQIRERLKFQPVDAGANVQFFVTKHEAPLLRRRRIDNIWVASDIQLYLDLWASPARGKEQAEHLCRERLSF